MTRRPARPAAFLAGALALALPLAGCVERALLVQSDPTGARVWVNGVDQGKTPVRIPYVHPGTFDIRLEKDGYEPVAEEFTTPTTVDAVPGPDFFYENGPWRVQREFTASYRLPPLRAVRLSHEQQQAVLRRAEAFRGQARAAAASDDAPVPTRPHDPPATSAPAGSRSTGK